MRARTAGKLKLIAVAHRSQGGDPPQVARCARRQGHGRGPGEGDSGGGKGREPRCKRGSENLGEWEQKPGGKKPAGTRSGLCPLPLLITCSVGREVRETGSAP